MDQLLLGLVCALVVALALVAASRNRARAEARAYREMLTPSHVARYRPRQTSTWREDD
jgi:hypothetical protein